MYIKLEPHPFQYTDFLERKYQYDKQWLKEQRDFDFDKTKAILQRVKDIHYEKSKKIKFFSLKENLSEIIEKIKEESPSENVEMHLKEVLPAYEFYQYVNLFFDLPKQYSPTDLNSIPENAWESFYKNLIELFVIRREDFDDSANVDSFLSNFSLRINIEQP